MSTTNHSVTSKGDTDTMNTFKDLDSDFFHPSREKKMTRAEKRRKKKLWQTTQTRPAFKFHPKENQDVLPDIPPPDCMTKPEPEILERSDVETLDINSEELQRLQQEDSTLENIRHILSNSNQKESGNAEFVMKKSIIYLQWSPASNDEDVGEQLVLPVRCRAEVLRLAHMIAMTGRLGVKKTTDRIFQRFYWPNIFHDVEEFCHSW